jgi:hypothetical protein
MHQPEHQTLIPLFEELRGERVLVRPFQAADAEAFWIALTESRERLLPWDTWPQCCQALEDVQTCSRTSAPTSFFAGKWKWASGTETSPYLPLHIRRVDLRRSPDAWLEAALRQPPP